MKIIDQILIKLENCITNSTYEAVKTEKIELKPTPPNKKMGVSLFQSICAFLNTNGGIVIIGIEEVIRLPKHYILKGYKEDGENLIKSIDSVFKDEKGTNIDVGSFINIEIKDFLKDRVAVLYVDNLPEEKKYAFFENLAYCRKMTGDEVIAQTKIDAHREYVQEIVNARELSPVIGVRLQDLDIDQLNEYIQILNKEIKIETIKADINSAVPFLKRKKFIINDEVTTLGMLVCGKHVEDYLGSRCQVDGFVDSSISVVQDKKVFKDNILPLMEKSVAYVYKNIQVGVSIEKGGTSIPEYPEKLIRECINNALAHRDYSIDKYVNINIRPNDHIEVRNPGSFKRSLLIEESDHEIPLRRILPDAKPNNPKLADILKVFNKWEGKGIGMATLVNESLDNNIDIPYYRIYSNESLGLFIRKGKLIDEHMELIFQTYDGFIFKRLNGINLTEEQKAVFSYLYKSEIENKNFRHTILLTPDNNHFQALSALENANLIQKHPKSADLYPIYIVDREFLKSDFHTELRAVFGGDYDNLSEDYKKTLMTIYQSNNYGKGPGINAKQIAMRIFFKNNRFVSDVKEFDNFTRKIRYIINNLEKRKFIIRKDSKPQYLINSNYHRSFSLFDT